MSGRRIRQTRRDMLLRQDELASMVGVSKTTIIQWEKGRNEPRPEHLRRLSDIFGKPIPWLRASDLKEDL